LPESEAQANGEGDIEMMGQQGCAQVEIFYSSDSHLDLERVRRRFVDRPISLIQLRHRYRCRSARCG
jgi:hypothetical protein